jgi:hypothetical protein
VIKHAGPGATVTVRLSYGDAAVRIEVTDTGVGPGPGLLAGGGQGIAGGHGIIGMRERAAAVAGTLVTGRGPDGGYQVIATMPCDVSPVPNAAQPDDAEPAGSETADTRPGDTMDKDAVPGDAEAAGARLGAGHAVRQAPPS